MLHLDKKYSLGFLVAGLLLATNGLCAIHVAWGTNFARYMHIERLRLGFNDELMEQLTDYSLIEYGYMGLGLLAFFAGIVCLVFAWLIYRKGKKI